jgi:hypothetical protein
VISRPTIRQEKAYDFLTDFPVHRHFPEPEIRTEMESNAYDFRQMNKEERTDNMKTETVPIDSISQDPANARKHDERNLTAIRDSLRAFGQQKPIVVDQREIVIAGNGTLEAAKRLGWTEIAIVRTKLDNTQATAFGIADNRTAELAEWDDEILALARSTRLADVEEMDALKIPDFAAVLDPFRRGRSHGSEYGNAASSSDA